MRFIIMPVGQSPQYEEGVIISDGVLGRITEDNVYLTAYPRWPSDDARTHRDLAVGECIERVEYRLSGSAGLYDVYRVA